MPWRTRALPSGNGTTAFFTAAENVPVTWTLPANNPAKDAGLVLWPKTPTLLEKPTTPDRPVRCADHAICPIRRAADAGDVRRVLDRWSLRAGNAADAVERARNAVHAGAEERRGAKRSPRE